jgi:hypothetical protein
LHFCDYLPFQENQALYLNNLKPPLPKDDLYQVLLKLACWFWRRFLKIFSVFLLFCYYLPMEKGNPLHFNNLESPSPKDDLCQFWLKLAQWFWRRSQKCKSLQTDGRHDGKTDDGQRAIRIDHLSSQLRWAKKVAAYGPKNTEDIYLVNRQDIHGLIHARIHRGKENTPGCGARGTGPPPLTMISLVTRLALCLAKTVANAQLLKRK